MSLPEHLEISGHLAFAEGNGGLRKMLVTTPAATAEVYVHGAHVTAFQKTGEPPLLFMSGSSNFSRSAPIRGGVPVIFPWFGPRDGMPSHGFARTVDWDILDTALLPDSSVRLRFGLPAVEYFNVEYLVTIGERLTLELIVRNTSNKDCSFESCFHTYFQVSEVEDISVTGLASTGYHDKVTGTNTLETSPAIRIADEVDRVYFDTTASVAIEDPGHQRRFVIEKSGSRSTVVWNPWIEKSAALPDFGDEEYRQMVCVESGNVGNDKSVLTPGASAAMKVEIRSEPLGRP